MAATTYLMYDGWRAKVDLRNRAVVRALKLDGISPRPLSRALLDAVPEAPPIVAPQIPAAGSPGPLRGIPVGSVVRVQRSTAEEFYVVLAQGVQRIGEVAADLIRFTNSQHIGVDTVSPDDVAAAPILDTLPVSSFPQRAGVSNDAVVCAHWRFSPSGADTAVTTVDSLGLNVTSPVSLAQADGDGPNVDAFSIPRGRSVYLRSTAIAGGDASAGALYFVDDSGVLYGLRDEDTAKYLGLTGTPTPAPWPVLAHLPRGPELSKEAASIARDSVAGPS
jgi:type VII secretion protein EccB